MVTNPDLRFSRPLVKQGSAVNTLFVRLRLQNREKFIEPGVVIPCQG